MNNLQESGNCINAKAHVIPGRTNLITGLAANAIVAAIRNLGPGELIVDQVEMGFLSTVASSTALAGLGFGFYKVSGFTALTNAGARAAEPVPVRKRNQDHRVLPAAFTDVKDDTAVQVEVSDTAALTGATIAPAPLFDDPLGFLICMSTLVTATSQLFEGQSVWEPREGIDRKSVV